MQDSILRQFRKIVTSQFISKNALKLNFALRSTNQLSGLDFVHMLLLQAGSGREMSYNNLNASLRKINSNINLSNQALAKHFYKASSANLIKCIYEKIFSFQKDRLLQTTSSKNRQMLTQFNRILVQDSTICILNDKLEAQFKGSGGCASKASLKIDMIHELKTGTILKIDITAGNKPDISNTNAILDEVQSGDLVLRDLGYCKLDSLEKLKAKQSYFVSRFHPSMMVYLNKSDTTPVDLGRYLKREYGHLNTIDITVYIGNSKEEHRLIAYRVPSEVSNERRRKAIRNSACKGRTASESLLNLADFVILITNIPPEKAEAGFIGTIYRLRWGIELIFKNWKSLCNLQLNLKGHKPTRIQCFVYVTLILALLTTLIHGWLKRIGYDKNGQEISLARLTQWLLNREGFFRLMFRSVYMLEEEIKSDLRAIRRQKRNRKTTLERVVIRENYAEKYAY